MNLGKNIKITRVCDSVAAGTANITTCTKIDMANSEGCLFITAIGTVSDDAVMTVQIQQDTNTTFSNASTLSGSSITVATTSDEGLIVHDIYKPIDGVLKVLVTRATGNCEVDSITAIQYGIRKVPVSQPSATSIETHISPAEGTG